MRGADFDWGLGARCALEDQDAGAFAEEGGDSVGHVGVDVFSEEEGLELRGIDVLEAGFDVKEEGGDCQSGSLEGANFMDKSGTSVQCAESREGAALVPVAESSCTCQGGEPYCHDPFENLCDGF